MKNTITCTCKCEIYMKDTFSDYWRNLKASIEPPLLIINFYISNACFLSWFDRAVYLNKVL